MCEALQNSLERRFSYLLGLEIHQAATALDPRVKLAFTNNTTDRKFFKFQSTMVKNIQNLLSESMIHSDSTTNSEKNAVLQPPPRKSLLDFSSLQPTNSSVSEIDVELQTYLESPVSAKSQPTGNSLRSRVLFAEETPTHSKICFLSQYLKNHNKTTEVHEGMPFSILIEELLTTW